MCKGEGDVSEFPTIPTVAVATNGRTEQSPPIRDDPVFGELRRQLQTDTEAEERGVRAGDARARESISSNTRGEGTGGDVSTKLTYSPSLSLRVMGWDCESECGYTCMTQHVESRVRKGMPVFQYHGKWPFR